MRKTYSVLLLILTLISIFSISLRIPVNPETSEGPIRVLTYNIHQYFIEEIGEVSDTEGRYIFRELLDTIEKVNPDIIGLQESEGARITTGNINGIMWLAHELDMYFYYGPSTSDQIYGVSVLSKWPILSEQTEFLPAEESIERVAVKVKIDTPYGVFSVLSAHFQTNSYKLDRTNQAQALIDLVGGDRAIILGDFNTRVNDSDPAFNLLNTTYNSAWLYAGNQYTSPDGYTIDAYDPRAKIDYIFLSKGDWSVDKAFTIGNRYASDHLGLYAEINPI